jgi:ArsR family transcriptional regulator
MLIDGEKCACEILEKLEITQPTLSYHMKMLCDSEIIVSRRDGAWMRYTLNKSKIIQITEYLKKLSGEKSI